jgi:hypothetical protein
VSYAATLSTLKAMFTTSMQKTHDFRYVIERQIVDILGITY